MPKLSDQQIERVASALGRPIANAEGACANFGEVTKSHLDDMRGLTSGGATLEAVLYVMLLLGEKCSLRNASSFVDNVVKRNHGVSEWLERHYQAD
jgi:hypothetical protein